MIKDMVYIRKAHLFFKKVDLFADGNWAIDFNQ